MLGEKNLDRGMVEYKHRRADESRDIARGEIVDFLTDQVLQASGR